MIFRNRLTRGAMALLALAAAALAADTSGKIMGAVKDPAGNLIFECHKFNGIGSRKLKSSGSCCLFDCDNDKI